jgi:glycosyltransferase involved in cell wall biosynthesis
MRETDVLVVPSMWMENAPLAVLQARAAGVPVIASDVPGVREIVDSPEQGVLVPAGDVVALADAMRSAILEGPRRYRPDPVINYSDHLDRVEAIYGESLSVLDLSPSPARLELDSIQPGAVGEMVQA